jgi:preprotein translocase subunit Sec61beta
MDDCVRQEYAISIILTGLITYVIVFFTLYLSRNSLLYYQHEGERLYLPISPSLIWQVSFFVAVVAAFAAALAFF